MTPEDLRRQGAALAERVQREVDTSRRLDIMLRQHQRQRIATFATAAAAVIAIVAGAILLFSAQEQPVITQPTPTTVQPGAQALPVEVFMVLVGDYSVDPDGGSCQGTGPLAGIGAGSQVHVWDETTYPSPEDAPTVALPDGAEIASDDPRASFLLSSGADSGCVFELGDLGYGISEFGSISLFPATDPDVAISSRNIGQRVVVTFGVQPGESTFDPVSTDPPP